MSDYCYSYPVFRRVQSQAEHMDRMLARAGISPVEVVRCDGGATWYEARTRCIDCPVDKQCRAWLDGNAAPAPEAVPDFCPNSTTFNEIRMGKS